MLTDTGGFSLERVLTRLPPVALVMAAKDIDLDAEPEEGAAGQLVRALDHLHDAEKRLTRAQEQQLKNEKQLRAVQEQLETPADSHDETSYAKLKQQLNGAEAEIEKSFRKVAREQAKLDDARNQVRQLSDNSH